jgi:hypothetical protein
LKRITWCGMMTYMVTILLSMVISYFSNASNVANLQGLFTYKNSAECEACSMSCDLSFMRARGRERLSYYIWLVRTVNELGMKLALNT